MQIKIYSDPAFKPENTNHPVLLSPFEGFGEAFENNSPRFSFYLMRPNPNIVFTSLEEADVAVFPVVWEDIDQDAQKQAFALRFMEKPRQAGKKVFIFYRSDSAQPLPVEDALIFRTSLYRSTKTPNDIAMPAIVEDFVVRYVGGKLQTRTKLPKPRVGFCGTSFLPGTFRERLREITVGIGMQAPKETDIRAKALRILMRSKHINANILIREDSWWAKSQEDKLSSRREYVQNMLDSDYTLCVRGVGNFSWRLYETLSCGRIPVFVNTDCVLPFEDKIDWKQYCVWVEQHEIEHMEEKVLDFHAGISPKDFIALQSACYKLWLERFSAEGFYSHLHEFIF